jgi:hypothetical protein
LSGGQLQGLATTPNGCIALADLFGMKLHVIKFAPDGGQQWNESLPGQGTPKIFSNIAVSRDSNIAAPVTDSSQFGRVMRLDAQGQPVWLNQSGWRCLLRSVAYDANGYPVATGSSNQPPPGCVTVEFSTADAIAEPANPPVPCVRPLLVSRILKPGQAVRLIAPRAGTYTISILAADGAVIRQVNNENLAAGEFRFAPGRLAAGSYYLRIAGPAGAAQEKFIELR